MRCDHQKLQVCKCLIIYFVIISFTECGNGVMIRQTTDDKVFLSASFQQHQFFLFNSTWFLQM